MRYPQFLRQRYRAILGYTGLVVFVIGLLILSPLLLLPIYQDELPLAGAFFWPGAGLIAAGALLWRWLTPAEPLSINRQEGAVVVLLAWLLAMGVGAIPFMAVEGLNFTQAVFEATSGWTTAGLTVVDVVRASPLILFYRSVLQLAGGAGLAIIMLSALAGPVGPGLSSAEGHSEQLLPHIRRSVNLVLKIYAGYVGVGIVALILAGMDWFDAVNHAFTALSTGGFSTKPASIGHWDSPAIEAVVIGLMLLGTLNFLTAYTLRQGNFRAVARNGEIRLSGVLFVLGAGILFLGVTWGVYPSLQKAVRVAIFETVTAFSTTGFTTTNYGPWPGLGWLVIVILMLIGGGTGSTAGGLKQYRIYVLYRGLLWEFRRQFTTQHTVTHPDVWQGEKQRFLSDTHLRQVSLFAFLYLLSFLAGSGILAAYGYPLRDSLFEFASAVGTVGLSVGITGAEAPAGVLWVETAGMFLGRLEFFTIVIGLTKLIKDLPVLLWGGEEE